MANIRVNIVDAKDDTYLYDNVTAIRVYDDRVAVDCDDDRIIHQIDDVEKIVITPEK